MIINQAALLGVGYTPNTWESRPRPSEWPQLPAIADNVFNGLIAVFDVPDGNRVALSVTVTGGFTVDWGDGTVDNWSSAATAQHQYDYSDTDLGPATIEGYKVALVKVTSTTPGNAWTVLNLQKRHTSIGVTYETGWLDINVSGPSLSTLTISAASQTVRLNYLWGCEFGNLGTASLANAFYNCTSLAKAPTLPSGFNASLSQTFYGCRSLVRVPDLPTSFANTLSSTFTGSGIVKAPAFSNASSLQGTFQSCLSLTQVALPTLSSSVSMNATFSGSNSLRKVTGNGTASDNSNTFANCNALESAALVGTYKSVSYASNNLSATALDAIYTNLAGLGTIGCTATGDGSTMTYTTASNHVYIAGQLISVTGMSISGYNVTSERITSVTANTFTVAGTTTGSGTGGTANGGAAATITVTGNWGTAGDNPSIATAKGWTVTG